MSDVLNIVILAPCESESIALQMISAWLPYPLKEISSRAGGTKAFEADIWAAAYNHVNSPAFIGFAIHAMRAHPIECGELQLLVKDEQEDLFTLYTKDSNPLLPFLRGTPMSTPVLTEDEKKICHLCEFRSPVPLPLCEDCKMPFCLNCSTLANHPAGLKSVCRDCA